MACRIPAIDRTGGFTLLESLLAAVVLAMLVAGVGEELSVTYQQTILLNQTATAVALGRELLEEIASKPLLDPSTNTTTPAANALTTARSSFTGVGDYNLYTDSGESLTTLGGSTVDATGGLTYTRTVWVTQGATPTGDTISPTSDFALVTVNVKTPSGRTVSLKRVVTNYTFTR
jgi:type II secretory pathway pseudopilin PulG